MKRILLCLFLLLALTGLPVFAAQEPLRGVWVSTVYNLDYPSKAGLSAQALADEADAIMRFRRSVTGYAGFAKTSGFIDDTRAFCSIPARHDVSRRVDSAFLANLVAEHRLAMDEALETIVDLTSTQPKKVFKL